MKTPYTVRMANAAEFAAAEPAWNAVVRRMRYPTPFARWEWVYTWWECMGRDSPALPIFIYHGTRLAAILPVFARPIAGPGAASAIEINYGSEELFADHVDLLCAPQEAEACALALHAFLTHEYRSWDVLRMPMVAEDAWLRRAFWRDGYGLAIEWSERSVAPYAPLPSDFDGFIAQLPSNDRQAVRRKHRKALEKGARYVKFSGDDLDQGLRHLFALHEKRASQKGIRSTFAGTETERFHFSLLRRLPAEQIMLRALAINDAIIACCYAFNVEDRAFFYQLGYDPQWSALSPGVAILTENIREAIALGCVEYNFLQGGESYKRHWARRSRRLLQFSLYNRTPAGRYLFVRSKAKDALKNMVRRFVPKARAGAGLAEHREGI